MPAGSKIKDEVLALWNSDRELVKKHHDWAQQLEQRLERLAEARRRFHQWRPLRVYTSVSRVQSSGNVVRFSLRFKGQEVGDLAIERDGRCWLVLDAERQKNNRKHFALPLSPAGGHDRVKLPWTGEEARAFRRHFRELYARQSAGPSRASEHQVESLMLEEMEKPGSDKFGGTLAGLQPVLLEGCPLQVPLPLSASGGRFRLQNGNIDILARSAGRRLTLWELKAPGEELKTKPERQVLCYALTLRQMLRDGAAGQRWYRLFGYHSDVPSTLTLRAAVALGDLPRSKQDRVADELRAFFAKNAASLRINDDRVEPELVLYETDVPSDPRRVTIQRTIPLLDGGA